MEVQRTDEKLWERIKNNVMEKEIAGTKANQWSARKAQLAVKMYKDAGGDYVGPKSANNSLVKWTKQDWTTKSGKPSSQTGERYLPREAIKQLTPSEYKRTSYKKKKDSKKGEQFSSQPKDIAEKVKKFRD
jgi:hypothetical protein